MLGRNAIRGFRAQHALATIKQLVHPRKRLVIQRNVKVLTVIAPLE
jgi:hypothetical protein